MLQIMKNIMIISVMIVLQAQSADSSILDDSTELMRQEVLSLWMQKDQLKKNDVLMRLNQKKSELKSGEDQLCLLEDNLIKTLKVFPQYMENHKMLERFWQVNERKVVDVSPDKVEEFIEFRKCVGTAIRSLISDLGQWKKKRGQVCFADLESQEESYIRVFEEQNIFGLLQNDKVKSAAAHIQHIFERDFPEDESSEDEDDTLTQTESGEDMLQKKICKHDQCESFQCIADSVRLQLAEYQDMQGCQLLLLEQFQIPMMYKSQRNGSCLERDYIFPLKAQHSQAEAFFDMFEGFAKKDKEYADLKTALNEGVAIMDSVCYKMTALMESLWSYGVQIIRGNGTEDPQYKARKFD